MNVQMGVIDDKRSSSCAIQSEVFEHLDVFRGMRTVFDINSVDLDLWRYVDMR